MLIDSENARRLAVHCTHQRRAGAFPCCLALLSCLVFFQPLRAESTRSTNFEVIGVSVDIAEAVARQAEDLRSAFARDWLGSELPAWEQKCVVRIESDGTALTGDTTYRVGPSGVTQCRMFLRGPLERIVETLLPHEVLHAVLATHFRRAVPRWADEGAALSVEAEVDQLRLWTLEGGRLQHGPRLTLAALFEMDQYPDDRDELRAFYAQGASITEFLLQAGRQRFLTFVDNGMHAGWQEAACACYGFRDIASLESAWVQWLKEARPAIALSDGQLLSDAVALVVAARAPAPGLMTDTSDSPGAANLQTVASVPDAGR